MNEYDRNPGGHMDESTETWTWVDDMSPAHDVSPWAVRIIWTALLACVLGMGLTVLGVGIAVMSWAVGR